MSDSSTEESSDLGAGSTLSFIDVITCGFGAAIILMMVYSTLPRMGESIAHGGQSGGNAAIPARGIPGDLEDKLGEFTAVRVVEVRPIDPAHRFPPQTMSARWSGRATDECRSYRDIYEHTIAFVLLCPQGLITTETQTIDLARQGGGVPVQVRARAYQGPWNALTPAETTWRSLPAPNYERAVRFHISSKEGKRVRYRTGGGQP
ncbi:hypothetical protein FIV42_10450 [Persicimonas caeni]|uniref:Uncharacterized protein n=1 Tax=Persicimonas caeni TaxID=2292766 RepID=A0A4Y6PSC2_PERCE|nr:hypothetical protein [Persicimonas caeni]QDG51140.1 hypothetical protein FIV42_10450 [Persicimonas caeni]QED32361.1 hypothetical protein FRD00_10445 [Persicimonas caeni]